LQVVSQHFLNGLYQLGSCGCHAVIHHSDIAEVKNDIIASGMK